MVDALDVQVKVLLECRKGDWQAVAEGAGVSHSWLSKFVNGHIENPGYATLVRLYAFLQPPVEPSGGNLLPTSKPLGSVPEGAQ